MRSGRTPHAQLASGRYALAAADGGRGGEADGSQASGRACEGEAIPKDRRASDCVCRTGIGLPKRAPSCDPLTASLAALQDEYEATVARFLCGPFSRHLTHARRSRWAHQTAPFVDEAAGVLGAPDGATWRKQLDALRKVIASVRVHGGYDYEAAALLAAPPVPAARPQDAGVDAGARAAPVGLDAGSALLLDAMVAPLHEAAALAVPVSP